MSISACDSCTRAGADCGCALCCSPLHSTPSYMRSRISSLPSRAETPQNQSEGKHRHEQQHEHEHGHGHGIMAVALCCAVRTKNPNMAHTPHISIFQTTPANTPPTMATRQPPINTHIRSHQRTSHMSCSLQGAACGASPSL